MIIDTSKKLTRDELVIIADKLANSTRELPPCVMDNLIDEVEDYAARKAKLIGWTRVFESSHEPAYGTKYVDLEGEISDPEEIKVTVDYNSSTDVVLFREYINGWLGNRKLDIADGSYEAAAMAVEYFSELKKRYPPEPPESGEKVVGSATTIESLSNSPVKPEETTSENTD